MKKRVQATALLALGAAIGGGVFPGPPLLAAETADAAAVNAYAIDNFFLFICAVLVIFMQAGFALVESGLNSAKNTVNILYKNLMDLSVGAILFFVIGYGLMYPGDAFTGGWFGFGGFGISADAPEAVAGNLHPAVDFLFQVAFAATAATIVSGAVAGRMKFQAYLIYSAVITAFIYPVSGMWKWGGGWLNELGFYDFAGSLVVHALGGFAGLAAAIVLGPRIGRFNADGSPNAMPGHNLAISTLGVFILLIGWFGFNPGSQLAIAGADNTSIVMVIATNTLLAAAAGAVLAMITAWALFKKPDLTMAMNGLLGGLVGITANCDSVTYNESLIIGAVAGILVVLGVKMLDAMKIDDPVGAWPVHGLNGIWGGLATGIFGGHPLMAQIIGSIAIPLWGFATMFILFLILKAAGILRVSKDDEMKGLDISEHEEEAYHGFQIFTNQ
ncbi:MULTISPECIES: ammonium transporter [Prosthecochloris]|uniref:Ammonium transporter n=1 Tax=Prosthecochloris vibrioformis TaxID=1098 RepID=A0A5C4S0D9_PROVB|nr:MULTISPECIES: ammonium transporter [Prosthecochloris]ANT65065.1 Ammonia transporter [Prosthecochloris sp. CIB 2401]TNJ36874.1 ammonium transporter [Prosthecochloris vibrioformis]